VLLMLLCKRWLGKGISAEVLRYGQLHIFLTKKMEIRYYFFGWRYCYRIMIKMLL
jgi:hypothetical protein